MSNVNSIYNIIKANITDGKLPEHFSLPVPEDRDQEIPFADGAMDGIYIYHMEHTDMTEEDKAQMAVAVSCLNRADYEGSDKELKKLGRMASAIGSIDEMQQYIRSHAHNPNDKPDPDNPGEIRLSLKNICDIARRLIAESENKESVKFGLLICEIFRSHPDQIKEVITTLGLSDEFTIFTVWNMLNWENGNSLIFDLIKKVRGWGRIHALEQLQPETPEIRRWIFMEGVDNDVMPAYSALTAWEKSDALDIIKSDLTTEEFHAAGFLMDALLDEGPVAGISALEEPEEALSAYMDQAEKQELNINDYDTILRIRNWASEDRANIPSIMTRCENVLNTPTCKAMAASAVGEGKAYELAETLGIDYSKTLFENMKNDFEKYHPQCFRLMEHEEYVDPVIQLFMEKLPLDEMKTGPTTSSGLGPEYSEYSKLLFIIQELSNYPGKGEELLAAGLNSPVVNNRFTSVRVLKDWTKITDKPIKQISPMLHGELYKLPSHEPVPEIKSDILDLLRGKIFTE